MVGILRVLLTTCPNNAKNAGGIDLHSEWSSCINLMLAHKEFFIEHGFKSKVFDKTTQLLHGKHEPTIKSADKDESKDNSED